ncbi:MAG: phosphate regulon transcriptional regulator PhoB [Rhodobacteraceae bacterium]|nr:phosphate regulon transcriptional regulator PhoB [Paracoccaceae bacterium]
MTPGAPLLLVVEDDQSQQELLTYHFEVAGFSVATVANGNEVLSQIDRHSPDLILLDWMIPGISGLTLCRMIRNSRKGKDIPILMLSARTEEEDRVRGLEAGADDYVAKPYSLLELTARIRALLRRTRPVSSGKRLTYMEIELDPVQHRVFRSGTNIELRPTEYRILATLMENPGRVWTRMQLLDRIWGQDINVETRTVDVHIGRLRKALCADGGRDPVRTVRGTGYSLD